jgi:hypothetical protein
MDINYESRTLYKTYMDGPMKLIITLVFFITLLSFSSCSGDKIDKQPSKKSAPVNTEEKPTASNIPNTQDLQPDLHISGTKNTHISGTTVTTHVSGR